MSEKKLVEFKTAIPPYEKPFLPTPGAEITFYVELPADANQAKLTIVRVMNMLKDNLIANQIAEHTVRFEDPSGQKTVLLDDEELMGNS